MNGIFIIWILMELLYLVCNNNNTNAYFIDPCGEIPLCI